MLARGVALCVVVGLGLCAQVVSAQTNERTYESFQSRVITPGARAIGMGKAFIGVADDATAAASNPAGLSNLSRVEISLEGTFARFETPRMIAVNPVRTRSFGESAASLSFASVVFPLTRVPGFGRVTLAVFKNTRQRQRDTFAIPNFDGEGRRIPQGGYWGSIDISEDELGVSLAYLVNDRLSIGGTVRRDSLKSRVVSNTSDASAPDALNFRSGSVAVGDDHKVSMDLGVLFRLSGRATVGASYQPGVTFDTTTTIRGVFTLDCIFDPVAQRCSNPTLPVEQISGFENPEFQTDFRIPSRFIAGASARVTPNLLLVIDGAFVRYSERITGKFLIVDFLAQPSHLLSRATYRVPDALEIHAGGEYRLRWSGKMIAIRGGVFTDPDHQMKFVMSASARTPVARGQEIQFNSFEPGTKFGGAFGVGTVLRNRFQIDVAVSRSFYEQQLVASTVYRF